METRWQRKLVLTALSVWVVVVFVTIGWLTLRPVTPTERRAASEAGEAAAAFDPASAAAASGQVNVVIFLIDTLRANRVGAYGYGKPTTPHMDALAAEGVVFEQCGAPAPWTLPSVVSLLTSTFPCEHRVLVDGQRIDGALEPLAARLHRSGYATASFLANAYAGPISGLDRGYDGCQRVGFTDGQTIDTWLDNVPAGKPMHVYIHNIEPHNPYNAPERLVGYFGQVPAGVIGAGRQQAG